MKMSSPILESQVYEGGNCQCETCGQSTMQMRRFDPAKPQIDRIHLKCFTCKAITTHKTEWDGLVT